MKTLLSISGGGMRGVIPAQWLIKLEAAIGPVWQWADLIGGTSTGGILALLMANGVSALKAMDFYCTSGPKIFKSDIFRKMYSAGGLIHTKYRSDVLERELANALGTSRMPEAKTKVMVTSMTSQREAEMIKSWHPDWQNLPMSKAAVMTSSAQTYFPQAAWRGKNYLDGGNIRNNPSVCVLTEALKLWPKEKLRLIHLGTGYKEKEKPLPNGGALGWAAEIFDTLTHGDDSYDDYHCKTLSEVLPVTYIRCDVALDSIPGLDDASVETIRTLRNKSMTAWNYLAEQIADMVPKI